MSKKSQLSQFNWSLIVVFTLVVLYLVTHLWGLTSLPVFADEAIYIRWAQLIMDEPLRYAFFPLNDGKTPLFIWLLVPLQYLWSDQLLAGRILSVLVGLGQVFAIGWLVKLLGGRRKTVWLGMLLTILLPYWYIHHKVALMDGMMTLFLSLSLGGMIGLSREVFASQKKMINPAQGLMGGIKGFIKLRKFVWSSVWEHRKWILITGVSLGLALWSKLTAVLFLPVLALVPLFDINLEKLTNIKAKKKEDKNPLWLQVFYAWKMLGMSLGLALVMFLSLKLHPAFGQLFSRGSDFLYPLSDFLNGAWRETVIGFPNYVNYFVTYLGASSLILMVASLFSPLKRQQHHVLFILMMAFALPIMLLGKVVYPRYLMPITIFATLSVTLAFQNFYDYFAQDKKILKLGVGSLILVLMLANLLASSGVFIYNSIFNVDQTNFVEADKEQYLYKWSSGHGIQETVGLIKEVSEESSVAVATEGYFGTLPDGLLMYFHGQDVTGISIEGIGQPILELPEDFLAKRQDYERLLLVVNSHRLQMIDKDMEQLELLQEFCRPDEAPCLQVWEVL